MKMGRKNRGFLWNLYPVQVLRLKLGKARDGSPLRELPYVFIIGFNKSGTRSLTSLLEHAGLPGVHWDKNRLVHRMLVNIKKGKRVLSGYDSRFLVYADLILSDESKVVEGNQFFPRLYDEYPNSFFILNTRPTEKWIDSRVRHGNGPFLARSMKILGTSEPTEVMDLWRSQKEMHESKVREFFSDKPGRLVEVNIESDNPSQLLSQALPFEVDDVGWRHVGRSRYNTQTSLERASQLSQLPESELVKIRLSVPKKVGKAVSRAFEKVWTFRR